MPDSFSNSLPSSASPSAGAHWAHQIVIDLAASALLAASPDLFDDDDDEDSDLLHPRNVSDVVTSNAIRMRERSGFIVRLVMDSPRAAVRTAVERADATDVKKARKDRRRKHRRHTGAHSTSSAISYL